MDNNSLAHYGVLGMKWGVRRYQNPDGTLTAAGKKHRKADYASEAKKMSNKELRAKIERLNLEKRYVRLYKNQTSRVSRFLDKYDEKVYKANKLNAMSKDMDKLRGVQRKGVDLGQEKLNIMSRGGALARRADSLAKDGKIARERMSKLDKMSDAQLREMVNRMDMEQQYSSLKQESVSRGKITTRDVLDTAGDVLAISASAAVIALQIYNKVKK